MQKSNATFNRILIFLQKRYRPIPFFFSSLPFPLLLTGFNSFTPIKYHRQVRNIRFYRVIPFILSHWINFAHEANFLSRCFNSVNIIWNIDLSITDSVSWNIWRHVVKRGALAQAFIYSWKVIGVDSKFCNREQEEHQHLAGLTF